MYTINPQKIPTMKEIALEMRNRAWSTGKNFALIGMMFSVYECNIETYRGKSDLWNGFLGGFCTGGTLGKKNCGHRIFLKLKITFYFLLRP